MKLLLRTSAAGDFQPASMTKIRKRLVSSGCLTAASSPTLDESSTPISGSTKGATSAVLGRGLMAIDFFRGRLIEASSVLMGIVFKVDEGYLGQNRLCPFNPIVSHADLRVSPQGPILCRVLTRGRFQLPGRPDPFRWPEPSIVPGLRADAPHRQAFFDDRPHHFEDPTLGADLPGGF